MAPVRRRTDEIAELFRHATSTAGLGLPRVDGAGLARDAARAHSCRTPSVAAKPRLMARSAPLADLATGAK
jgi:hypothetical protein